MLVVVAYDVGTESPDGAGRLRRVAKICESYGIRVQSSVFELDVDAGQLAMIKKQLMDVINTETDSVRFYRLGNTFKNKIETIGKSPRVTQYDPLIL